MELAIGWSDASWKPVQLGLLLMRLDALAGLESVKLWVENQLNDATLRAPLGDEIALRHILVKGALGTGKKTAAELIAMLLRLLHEVEDPAAMAKDKELSRDAKIDKVLSGAPAKVEPLKTGDQVHSGPSEPCPE